VGQSANRHDMKLVRETSENIVVERPDPTEEQPQGMCRDKHRKAGFQGQKGSKSVVHLCLSLVNPNFKTLS
jgi:hypothetical protein